MLDTIVLTLDVSDVTINEPDRFSPSASGLLQPPYYRLSGRGVVRCVLNTNSSAGYSPRLTLSKYARAAGYVTKLRVEFSAPKLVFGNNFEELETRDFCAVLAALQTSLARLGIEVDQSRLRSAEVSAVHYSKNILLRDYVTCSMALKDLERIDLSRLDVSRTDYRGGGRAIRYHSNSYELSFYDKVADLEAAAISEKRAIEQDALSQSELCHSLPPGTQVLRMELRLGTRDKIRRVLTKIGGLVKLSFETLFDLDIAKRCLDHFWAAVWQQARLLEPGALRPEELLPLLAGLAGPGARPTTLLAQMGWLQLLNSIGSRGAKALLARYCDPESVGRLSRKSRGLALPTKRTSLALDQVRIALERFEPLCLSTFQTRPVQGNLVSGTSQKRNNSYGIGDHAGH